MSSRVLAVLLSVAAVVFCGFEILYSTGIVGVTKKPNHTFAIPGCFCHGFTPDASTHVWIEGPDSLAAGTQAMYKIHVARAGNIGAGFNVASYFGSLGVADTTGTQLMEPNPGDSLELAHTHTKLANGRDTISWDFYFRAPLTIGLIDTLYANGNSVDTSYDPDGDFWNFAPNRLIRIVGTSAVAGDEQLPTAFILRQNHPNPFNPSTTITYELSSAGRVVLSVYDVTGRLVSELVRAEQTAGVHSAAFSPRGNASGIYFYRLEVSSVKGVAYSKTRKMVLLK
jgi:hypothetical protein